MKKGVLRWFSASFLCVAMLVAGVGPGLAMSVPAPNGDRAVLLPGTKYPDIGEEESMARLLALDLAFTSRRTAGDAQLSVQQAGERRAQAANAAEAIKQTPKASSGPTTFNAAWTSIGPSPIFQVQRSDLALTAESGRIGALAIRKNGDFILGAAQGGIWTFTPTTDLDGTTILGQWTNRTDSLPSLSTGALAVAPSNDLIVYAGTGEGALSGDSYFGNGILKSTDGGTTWSHVSGAYFAGVSISRLAVDPNNANHLYASVLRGRGGDRRVSPPTNSTFGIWESKDGAATWKLLKAAPASSLGATEIRMDPLNAKILYASFLGDKIYKSTDGGKRWQPIMNGLPANANFASGMTRFNIGLSHPAGQGAVLYTGFDWVDTAIPAKHHAARIFKSTNQGAKWFELPTTGATNADDSVLDYCGAQCSYDNVIEVDPNHPDIVFVGGSFGYNLSPQSGGIYRSDNGGQTWKNLGWDQHPDFHSVVFDPNNSAHVLIGSDGGVWYSTDRGGRLPGAVDEGDITAPSLDWQDLNGTPAGDSNGLAITQFGTIATNPTRTKRFIGGSQDNGTLRKFANSPQWYDISSGDGGQVLIDPTDWHYVYGTFPAVTPYRITDGGSNLFKFQFITNGLNTKDRSDFDIPFVMNQLNTSQLFTGTFRVYRTDNSKEPSAGDVRWKVISPDLTGGCTGTAPNGARTCALSAIGIGGGTAVYTGSLDGFVYVSPDAQVNNNPTWTRLGSSGQNSQNDTQGNGNSDNGEAKLPRRPVSQIAVDRSNYRIAYIAYAGFNGATKNRPGHVFKTADGGSSWSDISGNLPDTPVNSIILDPTYPNTLYAGTDVGPFVTNNGGLSWHAMGTGFPVVAVDQLDLDTFHRMIAAGTHGRSGFSIQDTSAPAPALVLTKSDAGVPVGPASYIDYTLTVHNIGPADATGVTITDPIPAHSTFVSADSGGTYSNGKVTWSGLTVASKVPAAGVTNDVPAPYGGSTAVHLRVQIDPNLSAGVKSIVNVGFNTTSAQGVAATGSPTVTAIAPPYALSLSPAAQTGGAQVGKSQSYTVSIKNLGYRTDSYQLSATGGTFPVTFYESTCTTLKTATDPVIAGSIANVCVKVSVPGTGTAAGTTSTSTIKARSVGSPTLSASGTITTIAVTTDTLLVGEDGHLPDVSAYYKDALTAAGAQYTFWDLTTNPDLPVKYMTAFKNIVWYTGTSWPSPITPYERSLTAFLDGGGHLFMSGQDILDQGGGTTDFVKNYLHITWDGSEKQNDKGTASVTGVTGNPVTGSIGSVTIDNTILGPAFMDQITPNGTATAAFMDDGSHPPAPGAGAQPDGLTFGGTYKVVFLAFGFEAYGAATDRTILMSKVIAWFTP